MPLIPRKEMKANIECTIKKSNENIFILVIMIIGSSDNHKFFACFFPLPVSCIRRGYTASFKELLRDYDSVVVYVCICWWRLLLRNRLYSSMDLDFLVICLLFFQRVEQFVQKKKRLVNVQI